MTWLKSNSLIKYLHVLFCLPLVTINHEIVPVSLYGFLHSKQDFPSHVTDSGPLHRLIPNLNRRHLLFHGPGRASF